MPPATPADIEDLSFWLADQLFSHAFEVFFYNLCVLCRSDPNIGANLASSSNATNEITLTACFKVENKEMVKEMVKCIVNESTIQNETGLPSWPVSAAEKSRMRDVWFRHQDAKQSTMVAHLNFLFKSDKFEACNVNHLYQVSASFTQKLASLPPSIQPLSPPLVCTL